MYFVTPMSIALLEKLSGNDVNATVSRSREAAAGPQMQEEKYVVGLALLLTLMFLGVVVSVLLCIATYREPALWMTIFEGLMPKNSTHRQFVKFPRRVRFQMPNSHGNRGSSKTMTHAQLYPISNGEEIQEQDYEDGTIIICP